MDKECRIQSKDYIEERYQKVIAPQHSSILEETLVENQNIKSILHNLTNNEVHFSSWDMSISKILIHKWIHWKHEYIYIGKIKIKPNLARILEFFILFC